MRFRRALDRGNTTEALSAAAELQFVGLVEALELTLLLAGDEPEKYERAAARWHLRFAGEVPHVDLRESQAVLALLAVLANRLAAAPRLLSGGLGRRRKRDMSVSLGCRRPVSFAQPRLVGPDGG